MKCLNCNNNVTNSTSGWCGFCLSNPELVRREESSTKVIQHKKTTTKEDFDKIDKVALTNLIYKYANLAINTNNNMDPNSLIGFVGWLGDLEELAK